MAERGVEAMEDRPRAKTYPLNSQRLHDSCNSEANCDGSKLECLGDTGGHETDSGRKTIRDASTTIKRTSRYTM